MKYVTALTDNFKFDDHIHTFDNDIYLFSTPEFEHKGVVVKRAQKHIPSRRLLKKEAETLLRLRPFFLEEYKIPEVLLYHSIDCAIVTQRLYGQNALEIITKGEGDIIPNLVEWVSRLHQINSNEKSYSISETETLQRFNNLVNKDDNGNPNFKEIKKLLRQWSKVRTHSKTSLLQGDLSPIHFYQENDGLYSLDFNGVTEGPVEEDIASFISNAKLHIGLVKGNQDVADSITKRFEKLYSERNNLDLKNLPFYVTFFDYLKARIREDFEQSLGTIIENLSDN
ncbi:phosphotransferase [archaeon]|jgi:hypothetical protein|nr:phosphotransferase [archaeon]MBT3450852.1 phosphotransferase [archaeon]MBT6868729.1 phosphotransferase [archaeon]MBT7192354.1 phosphotransferase [archaeon]MBT7381183.1 phosphotransferase [archaeon]